MPRTLPPKATDLQTLNSNGFPFKVTYGNLIESAKAGEFDLIAHGCNCHCVMGAGIAKVIRDTWPEAYKADLATKKGDRSKMGSYSSAIVGPLTTANPYTQSDYTPTKVDLDYDALRECLRKLKQDFSGKRIGLPLIGAGLASGNWNYIKEIIGETLAGEDVTVVILKDTVAPADDTPETGGGEEVSQW